MNGCLLPIAECHLPEPYHLEFWHPVAGSDTNSFVCRKLSKISRQSSQLLPAGNMKGLPERSASLPLSDLNHATSASSTCTSVRCVPSLKSRILRQVIEKKLVRIPGCFYPTLACGERSTEQMFASLCPELHRQDFMWSATTWQQFVAGNRSLEIDACRMFCAQPFHVTLRIWREQ